MPELEARLRAEGARALDVGCGIGWSSISLARAYGSLRVDGIDADEASIADAERLAAEAGVADRVRFEVADAAELEAAGEGGYDAAFVFEALHDMARPVEALRPATVRGWADRAGFASLRVLPIDHAFWRFYELSG